MIETYQALEHWWLRDSDDDSQAFRSILLVSRLEMIFEIMIKLSATLVDASEAITPLWSQHTMLPCPLSSAQTCASSLPRWWHYSQTDAYRTRPTPTA